MKKKKIIVQKTLASEYLKTKSGKRSLSDMYIISTFSLCTLIIKFMQSNKLVKLAAKGYPCSFVPYHFSQSSLVQLCVTLKGHIIISYAAAAAPPPPLRDLTTVKLVVMNDGMG